MSDRSHIKAALEAAKIELGNAIARVDSANEVQLAQLRGAAHLASAFVDFNSGCGKATLTAHELMSQLAR
jgi:hypothetical protein